MSVEPADIFYKVSAFSDLVEGEGKVVFAGVKRVAIFLADGKLYCIQNNCPHAGGHLGIGAVSGCIVKCPRHDWGFDFQTGACKTDPRYSVKRYEVKLEDGDVFVGLPEENPNAGPDFF